MTIAVDLGRKATKQTNKVYIEVFCYTNTVVHLMRIHIALEYVIIYHRVLVLTSQ